MFFLDKNVLEIAKLSSKPMETETTLLENLVFFTPDGRMFYSNRYFLVEYVLPTEKDIKEDSPQLALFEKEVKFKESFLSKTIAILGKEFVHTCDFKSEMPDVGEHAVIVENLLGKEPAAEIFWTSGVADNKTKHLIQSQVETPEFDKLLTDNFPNGSKLLLDSEYIKTVTSLFHKIAKSRGLDEEVMISIDTAKGIFKMNCECLNVIVMAKKHDDI